MRQGAAGCHPPENKGPFRGEGEGEECCRMLPPVMTDLRKFRLSRLNKPEFAHLKLLVYWIVFGLLFLFVERLSPVEQYFPVRCPLDDMIPFCEWFLLPYLFWFLYLIGIHVYTAIYDVKAFRGLMRFIMVSYSITIVIYFLFPTCQELRPAAFERDNALTRFIEWFYRFDTNTNVCPSLHVVGSAAVLCTAWYAKGLESKWVQAGFWVAAVLISISTVFMKQHSVVDVAAALPVCWIAWRLSFGRGGSFLRKEQRE